MANWFRFTLLATAIMNFVGAVVFALPIYGKGEIFGLPQNAHPLYLSIVSSWILIFGLGYIWMAVSAKPDRLFIAVAATCKLAIAFSFFTFWLMGDLPLLTVSAGSGDLLFAIVFIYWLLPTKRETKPGTLD
ncbi:hypothetical protein ACE1CI_00135 [Aerosakkonemataceae cyanobacterium BLCC-F50]|uniref:Uncharacterized protein n=1 Tax=Floridaenema flaviceps BLCC-F50 TaxID=3153642 RepID=A0ABV4XI15_9CYAN